MVKSISDIFNQYDEALKVTKDRLKRKNRQTFLELRDFYNDFLKNQIINYHDIFTNEDYRQFIHEEIENRFRRSNITFWAIDGASKIINRSELIIFYGGAYVVKGNLELRSNPLKIKYTESTPEDDVSLVAYLPLSPVDFTILNADDRFISSDESKINFSGIDTGLMLLAEIYLCYKGINEMHPPNLILLDHSISSLLAHATPDVLNLTFFGIEIGGERIWYPDLLVGYSKPWNRQIDVPSKKSQGLWQRLIYKVFQSADKKVDLAEFAIDVGLDIEKVKIQVKLLWQLDKYGKRDINLNDPNPNTALLLKDEENSLILHLNRDYLHAVEKVKRLYEHFCSKLFDEKDPSILQYNYEYQENHERNRIISQVELDFLQAIGLRLIIEKCWEKGTLLVGITKDSMNSYFTRNYLGVLRHKEIFNFESKIIPSTDRIVFEMLPYIDSSLKGPWSSTEFDSVFMTLRLIKDENEIPIISGVRGNILTLPNIINKSLVQFFFKREDDQEALMGHVIFMDRIIIPLENPETVEIAVGDASLGTVKPFVQLDNSNINSNQRMIIYLLSVLTRNIFPEVFGYPDPLHYADRGAKSVLRLVEPMLYSSEQLDKANPLYKTFRQLRDNLP